MDFSLALKKQMKRLDCHTADLAYSSSLSVSAISKFSSGVRIPTSDSGTLVQLIEGLKKIADNRGISFDTRKVYEELSSYCASQDGDYDFDRMVDNLNAIMDLLKISKTDYAQSISYDVSFVSRILSKERKPSNINAFMSSSIQYIIDNSSDNESLKALSILIDDNLSEMTPELRLEALNLWIGSNLTLRKKNTQMLLQDIDSFDLNSFINNDSLRSFASVANLFDFSTGKTYRNVEGFKKAVMDFAKISLLSGNREDIFIYDDVPVDTIIGTPDNYFKELILATTVILKKGLHISAVHVLEREIQENMLGIRFWVPLLMSGQIQTRCFERENENDERRVLFVSGSCALVGSFSSVNRTEGSFSLIRNKRLLPVYKENARLLLANSKELVYSYSKDNNEEFSLFCNRQIKEKKNLQIILSGPYATLVGESLLRKLMQENGMDEQSDEGRKLIEFIALRQAEVIELLQHNEIDLRLLVLSEQEFEEYPAMFAPIGFTMEKPLIYSYDLYCRHIVQIEAMARKYSNLHLTLMEDYELRNVQIVSRENEWFAVCKTSWPQVGFVTKHPQLCRALKQSVDMQQKG